MTNIIYLYLTYQTNRLTQCKYIYIRVHLTIGSVSCNCVLIDMIDIDYQTAPVWEITGAEFSKSEMHTADGISIRFPRCTRIRDDKDWKTATNLHQLRV